MESHLSQSHSQLCRLLTIALGLSVCLANAFSQDEGTSGSSQQPTSTDSSKKLWKGTVCSVETKSLGLGQAFVDINEYILGINGELFPRVRDVSRRGVTVRAESRGDGLQLVARDFPGRRNDMVLAYVLPDGRMDYTPDAVSNISLRAAVRKWPLRTQDDKIAPASSARKALELRTFDAPRSAVANAPKGATQWLMLCYNDRLLFPEKDQEKPENFLWVVPRPEGGFDLVHSGPLHSGVYATVRPDRIVVPGDGSLRPRPFGPKANFWQYYDVETGQVTASPFLYFGPLAGEETSSTGFKDGIFHEIRMVIVPVR